MAVNYIPTTDAGLVAWSVNFSTLISTSPTSYGLDSGNATTLAGLSSTYGTAYNAAIAGGTRGPMTVNTKDAAKANLIAYARQLATIIQANPAITDAQKTSLGITVRKTTVTPIPAPTTSPLLTFVAATPLQHTIRFADQLTPASRSKPFGVVSLNLVVTVAPIAPVTGTPIVIPITATKNPLGVNFNNAQAGWLATYLARWQTRTGLLGPTSNVLAQLVIGSGSD